MDRRFDVSLDDFEGKSYTSDVLRIIDPLVSAKIKEKYESLFPIQEATIPSLILPLKNDVCVSAPTGQGKTLCFAVPLLSNAVIKMRLTGEKMQLPLQALVVAPSKELALQTWKVMKELQSRPSEFEIETDGYDASDVRILCTAGNQSITEEARRFDYEHLPGFATGRTGRKTVQKYSNHRTSPHIWISTPGRLVEHFNRIQVQEREHEVFHDLETVVVDEADRLLSGVFDQWVDVITKIDAIQKLAINSIYKPEGEESTDCEEREFQIEKNIYSPHKKSKSSNMYSSSKVVSSKWMFSATLSPNDSALSALKMNKFPPPLWIRTKTSGGFVAQPQTLKQFYVALPEIDDRLPALVFVLHQIHANAVNLKRSIPKVLVFCTSKVSAHEVTKELRAHFRGNSEDEKGHSHFGISFIAPPASVLETDMLLSQNPSISVFNDGGNRKLLYVDEIPKLEIGELSSDLSNKSRTIAVKAFEAAKMNVMVASDVIARGVDISNVDIVVNFDLPSSYTGYIHRSGRTARGLSWGCTLTLVSDNFIPKLRKIINACVDGGWSSLVRYPLAVLEVINSRKDISNG
eukprot:GHVP01014129.1.p1 GENE.GHVP01014129.1~~GHVP01014129.1.p1  ORF type:complete len:576 (-),score=110.82 GHVP01014129.1:116-1843(-)